MPDSTMRDTAAELPMSGPGAPPRRNGELVFREPWQARLFGLTLELVEREIFSWERFQAELIACIGARERASGSAEVIAPTETDATDSPIATADDEETERLYYDSWLVALEHLLGRCGLVDSLELLRLREMLAAEHDHDHAHDRHPHAH